MDQRPHASRNVPALIVALLTAFSAHVIAATGEPAALPAWREGDSRDGWLAEGWLAGWELLGLDPELEANWPEEAHLPEPALGAAPEPPSSTDPVPEPLADAYFAKPPSDFVTDPQRLLTPDERERIHRLLASHAEEAAVGVQVFLFGARQEIPTDWRVEEQAERLHQPQRPSVMLVFHLAAPHRSEIYLPPILARHISLAEQRRTLESCVLQAQSQVDPAGQLDAFLQQLAIRAYWIGHTCGLERVDAGLSTENRSWPAPAAANKKKPKWQLPPEVTRFWLDCLTLWPWLAMAAGALGLAFLLGIVRRLRQKHRFPEIAIEPRLGGPYAAGVGAAISFASVQLPPSAQRSRPPDL